MQDNPPTVTSITGAALDSNLATSAASSGGIGPRAHGDIASLRPVRRHATKKLHVASRRTGAVASLKPDSARPLCFGMARSESQRSRNHVTRVSRGYHDVSSSTRIRRRELNASREALSGCPRSKVEISARPKSPAARLKVHETPFDGPTASLEGN